jgi:hypothetical protein
MSDKTEQAQQDPEDIFAALMGDDVSQAPEPVPKGEDEQIPHDAEPEQAAASEPATKAEPEIGDEVKKKLARLAEVEDNFSKLQRDYQAVYGRLAPMQRKIAEMEQAARASSEAVSKPPQGQSAGTEESLHDDLKPLEEDYPEIARAIKAEREASQRRLQALEQRFEQMGSTFEPVVRQFGHQTEVQRLTQAHPDWQDINASEDFQGFVSWWWSNQPPAFRQAIGGDEGLMRAFNQAEFTIPLLNQYKELRKQPAQPPAPAPAQRSQPNAQTGRRAMSAAPNVRSSGLPPAVDMSSLPEEDQFAMLMEQAGIR